MNISGMQAAVMQPVRAQTSFEKLVDSDFAPDMEHDTGLRVLMNVFSDT